MAGTFIHYPAPESAVTELLPVDNPRSTTPTPPRFYQSRRPESHSSDGGGHPQRDHRRSRGAPPVDVHYRADLQSMPEALLIPMPATRRQDDSGPAPFSSPALYPTDGEVCLRQTQPAGTPVPSTRNSHEWDHQQNSPTESALAKALRVADGHPQNARHH